MRKALVLFLILAVLVSSLFLIAHAAVNSQKDRVTWQEQTLAGDPAVVSGLRVSTQNAYDASLLWNTTGVLGQTLEPKTEFVFSNQNHRMETPVTYQGVELYTGSLYDLQSTQWMTPYEKEKLAGVIDAYNACVEETPEHSEKSFTIDLTQYLEYYHLEGRFDLPGYTNWYWGDAQDLAPQLADAERIFNEYFQIPITGVYTVDVVVDKIFDNVSPTTGISMDYSPYFYGVLGEDVCYFTFDPVLSDGQSVDCSHIPGGYGIYSFRYTYKEEEGSLVDLDSLSTVYPLDPSERFGQIWLSEDGSRLLLQTFGDDICYLTVIDTKTMTCLQKIELITAPEEGYVELRIEEDFIAVLGYVYQGSRQNTISLFARLEDGTYEKRFQVPLDHEAVSLGDILSYERFFRCAAVYDGTHLTLGLNLNRLEGEEVIYRDTCCDFYIASYGPEGMAYAGQYRVSLAYVNDTNLAFPCKPFGIDPIKLCWE